MATASPTHVRTPSVTLLDCEVNPNFTFPLRHDQPRTSPLDSGVAFQFPSPGTPLSAVGEYQYPPLRRGSAPLQASAPLVSPVRPRARSEGLLRKATEGATVFKANELGVPSPVSQPSLSPIARRSASGTPPFSFGGRDRSVGSNVAPAVLNATVTLGPVPAPHKRDASRQLLEVPPLVGDDVENDGASTPPTRGKAAPSPVGARRGHAHRRSGAISSGDVWSLMNNSAPSLSIPKANAKISPSSSPTLLPNPSPPHSWSAPVSPDFGEQAPVVLPNPLADPNLPISEKRGSRVSFVDQVEVIPSEEAEEVPEAAPAETTESDRVSPPSSPARRGRTRSNSQTLLQPTAALRAACDRPSTAGAILVNPEQKKGEEEVKSKLESLRPATSPFTDGKDKKQRKKSHKKAKSDFSPFLKFGNSEKTTDRSQASAETEKPKRKNKKKIKNWAGQKIKGLRHSKKHSKHSHRTPTPPVPQNELATGDTDIVATSWNESYVIMPAGTSPALDIAGVSLNKSFANDRPTIDLDAALRPFDAPTGSSASISAAKRRRMHSAGGRGIASAFHRRSESMPEMNYAGFSVVQDDDRQMEDVFEEEEEEEESSSDDSSDDESDEEHTDAEGLGIGIKISDEPEWQGGEMEWGPEDQHSDSDSWDARSPAASPQPSPMTLTKRQKHTPPDIITPLSLASMDPSAIKTSDNPALDSPSTFVSAKSNLDTPTFEAGFDGQYEDEGHFNPYNDYLGEPGPEMRMSADDVPSLTSSSSTMTVSAAMPSTPGTGDMMPAMDSASNPKHSSSWSRESCSKKERASRRWSRVFGFWKVK